MYLSHAHAAHKHTHTHKLYMNHFIEILCVFLCVHMTCNHGCFCCINPNQTFQNNHSASAMLWKMKRNDPIMCTIDAVACCCCML